MAELGITKLEAINEMLAAVEELPVSTLDTGGASIAAMAERHLDRETQRVQMEGYADNTDLCRGVVANGSGQIVAESTWLAVQGAGPDAYRNLTLRAGNVWSLDNHTDTITTSGGTVYLNIVRQLEWADMSPRLKNAVLARSIRIFQRRQKGDPQADLMLAEESAMAAVVADRPSPRKGYADEPIQKFPLMRPPQQPVQQ